MTDQDFETTKERIKASVGKWLKPLGLLWWQDITMEYYRNSAEMQKSIGHDVPTECIADTHVAWEYCHAVVRWNCYRAYGCSDEDLDYSVRHELAHILVREMREWGDKDSDNKIGHEERVCTMLGQAFDWIWQAAVESVKSEPEGSSEVRSS